MSRPISDWYGFMGQRAIVRVLRRVVEGAKAQGRTVGPVILTGPSGSGKTTLANAVAKCQGTQQRVLVANSLLSMSTSMVHLMMFAFIPGHLRHRK